jgi:hypothetical protein
MWLEDEQKELLARFVEAHRNVPRELRGAFLVIEELANPQATFIHSRVRGLKFEGSISDAEVLAQLGLISLSYNSKGGSSFSVLPQGIQFYEESKKSSPAVQTVEDDIRHFISAPEFKETYPNAFAKWEQAASLLWAADSDQQLSTIGHLCRETLQEFATSLANHEHIDVSAIEPTKTVARLKTILAKRRVTLGTTEAAFLDELISYWGIVSDLVQRQEHGAQREEIPLVWEDARRVVFQSCVLMFEVARTIQ